MKRRLASILSLVLLAGILLTVSAFAESGALPAPPHPNDDFSVLAVFAKAHAQPIDMPASPEGEEIQIMADTLWIYYSDSTFEQYAETPLGYELFSTGTYSLKDDVVLTGSGTYAFDETGDFQIIPFEEDNGKITMSFDYSIQNSEPASMTFDLSPLGSACFYVARPASTIK